MRMNSFAAIVVFAFLGLVAAGASAQEREPFQTGMFFSDAASCQAAYINGTARGYMPAPNHLVKSPLKEAKGLPTAYCVQEDPRGESTLKAPWMVLMPGTPVIFGADGKPIRDGRCNNKIHEAVALPLPQGPRGPQGPKGEAGSTGPRGPQGETGQTIFRIPPPEPVAPATKPVKKVKVARESEDAPKFSFGVGYEFCSEHTDYTYPDPKKGDVPQDHNCQMPIVMGRYDSGESSGVIVEGSATFLGKTSNTVYTDLTGTANDKKRDSDTSRNKVYRFKGGYKFGAGESLSIGAALEAEVSCYCQSYFAQNTDTSTDTKFTTYGLNVEASGSTNSSDHRVTIRVDGTIGLAGHRNRSTTQFYHGPPATTFPQVNDAEEQAKLNRIGADVGVQIAGPLSIFANVGYSQWSSEQPINHTAHVRRSILGTVMGFRVSF